MVCGTLSIECNGAAAIANIVYRIKSMAVSNDISEVQAQHTTGTSVVLKSDLVNRYRVLKW